MIVAVRHPAPAIAGSICYGQLDVGLAAPVADSVARILSRLPSGGFDRIVASPLQRARLVGEALARHFGLELTTEPRLQELTFGSWEGREWAAIARDEIDAWAADPLGYRAGGGETVSELAQRVGAVWREASAGATRQLWITHAGPMRCLYAESAGLPLADCLDKAIAYEDALLL